MQAEEGPPSRWGRLANGSDTGALPDAFRILSLSGGGYLGMYTLAMLVELEAQLGAPLGRHFQLIAGTSVGGILALALGFEIPMRDIQSLFLAHGSEVFSARALPTGTVSRLLDLSRSVLGPKYDGAALRAALTRHFGAATLGQSRHRLVIPSVNISRSCTKVFKTPHAVDSLGDEGVAAVDIAMATSAAPGFFPAVRIGDDLFADGGMFAVAPDQVALHEAGHFMHVDTRRVRLLSIGTGTAGYRPAEGLDAEAGAVGWLANGRLLLTLISVQQQHVQAMMEDRLQGAYLRLDAPWPAQAGLGIDVATPHCAGVLSAMAGRTIDMLGDTVLSEFLQLKR